MNSGPQAYGNQRVLQQDISESYERTLAATNELQLGVVRFLLPGKQLSSPFALRTGEIDLHNTSI
jgi:hypothetical protein